MSDIQPTDETLLAEFKELTERIGRAIAHREDIIEELERRGLRDRKLTGLEPVCNAVADVLGISRITVPPELGKRDRDETYWWTNTKSVGAIVKAFLLGTQRDSLRWQFYAASPQTALMLGSKLDPNDDTIDWVAECNRLADDIMERAKA